MQGIYCESVKLMNMVYRTKALFDSMRRMTSNHSIKLLKIIYPIWMSWLTIYIDIWRNNAMWNKQIYSGVAFALKYTQSRCFLRSMECCCVEHLDYVTSNGLGLPTICDTWSAYSRIFPKWTGSISSSSAASQRGGATGENLCKNMKKPHDFSWGFRPLTKSSTVFSNGKKQEKGKATSNK